MTRNGFTLIEVIIAIAIVAVGLLALFSLQASTLTSNRNATLLQELNDLARSEIELQREFNRVVETAVTGETCTVTTEPSGFGCQVDVFPCQYVLATDRLSCGTATIVDAPARQIVVSVSAPSGRTFQLSTVVKTKVADAGP